MAAISAAAMEVEDRSNDWPRKNIMAADEQSSFDPNDEHSSFDPNRSSKYRPADQANIAQLIEQISSGRQDVRHYEREKHVCCCSKFES